MAATSAVIPGWGRIRKVVIGRADDNSLQVKFDLTHSPCKLGPWGGNDGSEWDDGFGHDIRGIVVHSGDVVDSIQLTYKDGVVGPKHGGDGGRQSTISLVPGEYMTRIEGSHGMYEGEIVIYSLTIYTNIGSYGPFGRVIEKRFASGSGSITGFYGRAGKVLNAIGCYDGRLIPP